MEYRYLDHTEGVHYCNEDRLEVIFKAGGVWYLIPFYVLDDYALHNEKLNDWLKYAEKEYWKKGGEKDYVGMVEFLKTIIKNDLPQMASYIYYPYGRA